MASVIQLTRPPCHARSPPALVPPWFPTCCWCCCWCCGGAWAVPVASSSTSESSSSCGVKANPVIPTTTYHHRHIQQQQQPLARAPCVTPTRKRRGSTRLTRPPNQRLPRTHSSTGDLLVIYWCGRQVATRAATAVPGSPVVRATDDSVTASTGSPTTCVLPPPGVRPTHRAQQPE